MENICIAHGGDITIPCGGTNRVLAFTRALSDNGFEIHLVVPSPKGEIPKDLQKTSNIHTVSIKATSIKDQPLRALLVSLKAKRIAKENNAILQIEHSTLAGFATFVGCSNFVLDMHDLAFMSPLYGNLIFSRLIQNFIYKVERRAVDHASKIIVVSNPMKDFIMKEWNISEEKIEVIPNGYYEDKFRNFNFDNIEEVDGMIVFMGTLHPKLDIGKIILLAKSLSSSKIYIIGDGPVRDELERRIREHNIKNVTLTGGLSDERVFDLLAKSQVAILPLRYSLLTKVSCPVKLFDYAALGKAIVADDISEMCRIFKENNAALVSDPENKEKFIENVKRLLEDEKLRKEISSDARRLIKDFTWEKQGEKLVRMYKNLI